MKKTYDLPDFKKKAQAKSPGFDIKVGDKVIEIPPIKFWSRETLKKLKGDQDIAGVCEDLLGDDLEAFESSGGTPGLLMEMVEDSEDMSMGESSAS